MGINPKAETLDNTYWLSVLNGQQHESDNIVTEKEVQGLVKKLLTPFKRRIKLNPKRTRTKTTSTRTSKKTKKE